MTDKTEAPCEVVRDGDEIVFRMPVARLLRLTADEHGDIGPGEDYISDLLASLNRGAERGRPEIEKLLVAEYDNVQELLAGIEDDVDDEPSAAPAP